MASADIIVFQNFLIAIAIGALLGLEKEQLIQKLKLKRFSGLRTSILIALFGAISGYLSKEIFESIYIVAIAFGGLIALVIAGYFATSFIKKSIGGTQEIATILIFMLGLMTSVGYANFAIVLAVIIAAIIAWRKPLHTFAKKIESSEILAMVKFAIISLVILPFLPNVNYTPLDIPLIGSLLSNIISPELLAQIDVFNLYKIWLMVVFISAIGFTGYVLMKWIGSRGIIATGFLGGLVSSTAVTSAMSDKSLKTKLYASALAAAVIVATCTKFVRVLFEVAVLNPSLLATLAVPMLTMLGTGLISSYYIVNKVKKKQATVQHKEIDKLKSPFTITPALQFGAFFAVVLTAAKVAQVFFGNIGIYFAAALSGLADVDAITISMASLSSQGDIAGAVAVTAITVAVITNTIVKSAIAYLFGAKQFAKNVILILTITLIAGGLSLLFI